MKNHLDILLVVVSVPYWGSLYFNDIPISLIDNSIKVSVPYWGSLYFNTNKKFGDVYYAEFPSPIGVLYISIIKGTK